MTTIEETMDEFFDFEDAAHPLPHSDYDGNAFLHQGPYDIDLAFAEPENDENSFTCLQHFDGTPEQQLSLELHGLGNNVQDTTMMGPGDFSDFPRWIEGMDVPTKPCDYCQVMRIHCKVLKEGLRKGSCTSCVALARGCSLTFVDTATADYDGVETYGGINIPSSAALGDAGWYHNVWADGKGGKEAWESQNGSLEDLVHPSHSMSATDLKGLAAENGNVDEQETGGPKVGARFSRESVRVLRGWLSTHHRHPYPNDEEKESLKRQTGLNKTQITNWLANARRRGKVRAPRSMSPSPHQQYANGMDIPRQATPALQLHPMERWKNSPPEHEPASVTAIAKAVSTSTFSSGHDSPYTRYGQSDDGSARSLCNVSSTSSLGTSHSSGGSFASAFSHKSRGSFGSFSSLGNRGRRRRRRQAPNPVKVSNLATAPRTFQCTFCTETFKTKHDWQRHEKSLHLSLERWVCSPNGHSQFNAECNAMACVYCGMANPVEGHAEQHNHSSCTERSLEERTFYRKDHLRQHLNLVHDAKFQAWSMDVWKVATPEIRSRCGFCGVIMDSWSIRVDHLAEHFKGGKSMADWKGDWGFEPQVLDIVENGMPPYLIHDERNTPAPFEAKNQNSPEKAKTLEDLVKTDLIDYINDRVIAGLIPTDEDLLAEARKVIKKADALIDYAPEESWFRDLILFSGENARSDSVDYEDISAPDEHMTWAEKLDSIHTKNQTHMMELGRISCTKERALKTYVKTRQALGLTPLDSELQVQACRILDEVEVTSNFKCKPAVQWFKYLITASPHWLAEFRRRALLPRSSEMVNEHIRPLDETKIDYTIHNYHRLERELVEFVNQQRAMGRTPTDPDLQAKARMIIYESDDAWNQTAADDPNYLEVFKRQNGLATIQEEDELPAPTVEGALGLSLLQNLGGSPPADNSLYLPNLHWNLEGNNLGLPSPVSSNDHSTPAKSGKSTPPSAVAPALHTLAQNQPSTNTNPTQPLRYFLNDANCYGRLVRELTRFVTSCTSLNNPAQHIPSDAELQNQARWVIYDDDDPWNQTAADNAEWLVRFKRDVGLLPKSDGPGLPHAAKSWQVSGGGSGFSPPYINPGNAAKLPGLGFEKNVDVTMEDKVFKISPSTAKKFVRSLEEGNRFQPPGSIFCSRDLEIGLAEMVKSEVAKGIVPSDEHLRAKAREILNVDKTAADEPELLAKFKALHGISSSPDMGFVDGGPLPDFSLPNFTDDVAMLAEFDLELGTMDLTTEFSSGVPLSTEMGNLLQPIGIGRPQNQNLGLPIGNWKTGQGGDELPGQNQSSQAMGGDQLGDLRDYADKYRVSAATASPLRRRVSERLARGTGYPASGHSGQRGQPEQPSQRRVENVQGRLERNWSAEGGTGDLILASGHLKCWPGTAFVRIEEGKAWNRE